MSAVFLDTSVVAAVVLNEPGANRMARRIAEADVVLASNLLEAELRAVLLREGLEWPAEMMEPLRWIMPTRPLTNELNRALAIGYLRGADLWHVACALFAFPHPAQATFLTLDVSQRAVASSLGFVTDWATR